MNKQTHESALYCVKDNEGLYFTPSGWSCYPCLMTQKEAATYVRRLQKEIPERGVTSAEYTMSNVDKALEQVKALPAIDHTNDEQVDARIDLVSKITADFQLNEVEMDEFYDALSELE